MPLVVDHVVGELEHEEEGVMVWTVTGALQNHSRTSIPAIWLHVQRGPIGQAGVIALLHVAMEFKQEHANVAVEMKVTVRDLQRVINSAKDRTHR